MGKTDLDELMASMGVRKLDQGKARTPRKKAPPSSGKPTRTRKAVSSKSDPSSSPAAQPARDAELKALREEVQARQVELEQARTQTEELRRELSAAQEARVQLESRKAELQATEQELRVQLAVSRGDEESEGTGLVSILASRGILGEDERRYVMAALGEGRQLDGLLKSLVVASPETTKAWLERRLVLTCADASCQGASGLVAVEVAPSRCELCAGFGLNKGARDFISGLLVHGWRHCLIVGGAAWVPRAVSSVLDHPRITTQVISSMSLRSERLEVTAADLVILWGDIEPDQCRDAGIELPQCTLSFDVSSLGQLLSRAAARLMAMD